MPRRARRELRRAGPVSRFPCVVRERLDHSLQRAGVRALERCGDRAVQRDPLAHEEVGVDRLARERVPEGEPLSRLLDDELRCDELLHEREQLVLVLVGEHAEELEVEPAAGHRGDRRDRARRHGERRDPAPHRFDRRARHPHALERLRAPTAVARHEVPRDHQRLERLLDEEGIPLGEAVDQLDELVAEVGARTEDRVEHRAHLGAAEWLHRQLGDEPCALELRDQPREPRADLLAAVGEHDAHRLRGVAPREMEDEIERRVVAPVHILHGEEHRLRVRQQRDRPRDGVEQPPPVGVRIGRRGRSGFGQQGLQLGKERDQLRRGRREHVGDERRRRRLGEQAHEVEQRGVRDRAVGLVARAAHREVAAAARLVGHRLEEPRLADARLADDERDLSRAATRTVEHRTHGVELGVATYDRRADDIVPEMHGGRLHGPSGGVNGSSRQSQWPDTTPPVTGSEYLVAGLASKPHRTRGRTRGGRHRRGTCSTARHRN